MTDKAEQIAAGLTEAQRAALLKVRDWPREGNFVLSVASMPVNTARALERRGLILRRNAGVNFYFLLSDLGLAVRTILERQSQP